MNFGWVGREEVLLKIQKSNLPALGTLETDFRPPPPFFFLHWAIEPGQLVLGVWGRWVECCLFGLLVLMQTYES